MRRIESYCDGVILIKECFTPPFAQAIFSVKSQVFDDIAHEGVRHDNLFLCVDTQRTSCTAQAAAQT